MAIGQAITQVAVSMKDVLREMKELKPTSAKPKDEDSEEASVKDYSGPHNSDDSCGGDLGNDFSPEEMKIAQLAIGVVSETLVVIKELIRFITSFNKQENPDNGNDFVNLLERLLKLCQEIGPTELFVVELFGQIQTFWFLHVFVFHWEFTDKLIEEELSADQKDAFKDFVRKVGEGKKANREAREARKKALAEMSEKTKTAFQNMKFYKFYPVPTPDVSNFKALGFQMPYFAHVSLILAPDRSKLSKRHGATSMGQYREMGYLPQAMVNYLALLGWGDGTENEFLSLEKLANTFLIFFIFVQFTNLWWMNGQHLRSFSLEELTKLIGQHWKSTGILAESEGMFVEEAVQLLKDGIDLITDSDKALSNLLSYPLYATLAR
ncbi:hypothetical protein RHMOL_Rhmol03G0149900 [Rhododendron molle]|uniref:Uncharacterized protein n=1 Tax=Rhododendron molle TaxID=49168 RepID=A0ACC0PE90_RHOML|nr:hypothetical protein RHMOL_Rhmol03G0149900 [Rhododendron molle]